MGAVIEDTWQRCTRCGKKLKAKDIVFLELNTATGKFCESDTVPEKDSQGCFPFGPDCARHANEEKGKKR